MSALRAERPIPLRTLERFMQGVIVSPAGIEEAVSASCEETGVSRAVADAVFLPSARMSASERLAVYQGMYPLRMQEALSSDYPYVKAWVGDHVFEHLVEDYVREFPSRSYTLNRLGDAFPEFLLSSRRVSRPAVLADLARLELAFTAAFDAEETPAASPAELGAIPPEAWEKARFDVVASFQLLSLAHPVGLFVDAVKEERPLPRITRRPAHYAVYRRDFAVYRLDLTLQQRELLHRLSTGATLAQAILATTTGLSRRRRSVPPEGLFETFRDFSAQGLFQRVRY